MSSRFARDVAAVDAEANDEDAAYAADDKEAEVEEGAVRRRGVRSLGERERATPVARATVGRAPGLSVATVAVVGMFTLVVLAAAAGTIASMATRASPASRPKANGDVLLGPVVGITVAAAAEGHGLELSNVAVLNTEKMKHL